MSMLTARPNVIVFATGEEEYGHGGSGFKTMVLNSRMGSSVLDANIVAGISNYENGGIRQKCDDLGVPFEFRPKGFTSDWYQYMMEKYKADYAMCSGWLKYVKGINPSRVLNIHPGLFPWTKGLWGDAVHLRAIELFEAGETATTGLTIHFVTWKENDPDKTEYDNGPVACQKLIYMEKGDDLKKIKERVNSAEHVMQSMILDLVVHGRIYYHEGKVRVQDYQLKRFLGLN